MKAIVYTEYGSPDVLHLKEVAKPAPKDNEVLIRVYATTVTTGDCNLRGFTFVPRGFGLISRLMSGYRKPRKTILGVEVAGEIEVIGKDVTRFKKGDAVFGINGTGLGAYAEYKCMSEAGGLVLKPVNLTYVEAAAIPNGALTALTFLILYNAVSMRLRDRTDVGGQIADLSRGTADLARQVAEFGRRLSVIEGKVVFSDETVWDPYFQPDPQYHFEGIMDSLKKAAGHLPRVDAIGGSAAGVYVNNRVKVASLFRGVPQDAFDRRVRELFFEVKRSWNNIPLEVVNDGEVTALAGSMSLGRNRVLGISLGTSTAGGYVNSEGNITSWLNELAFEWGRIPVGQQPSPGRSMADLRKAEFDTHCPIRRSQDIVDSERERLLSLTGQLSEREPLAKKATIAQVFDLTIVRKLEKEGFFKNVFKKP